MKEDLFRSLRVDAMDEKCTSIYVEYLVDLFVYHTEGKINFSKLYPYVLQNYDNQVKSTHIKYFIQHYLRNTKYKDQWLKKNSDNDIATALQTADRIRKHGMTVNSLDRITNNKASISLGIAVCEYLYSDSTEEVDLVFKIYKYLKTRDKYSRDIDTSLSMISSKYDNIKLKEVFELSPKYLAIVWKFNLETIASLKSVNPLFLTDVFFFEIDQLIQLLGVLKETPEEIVARCFQGIDKKDKEIINMRYDLNKHNDKKTLEEVGKKFGLTRERIRQKEKRATLILQKNIVQYMPSLKTMFYSMDVNNNNYITFPQLSEWLNNDDLLEDYLLCYCLGDFEIGYDSNYFLLYDKKFFSIKELVNQALTTLGDLFDIRQINLENNPLLSIVIEENYRKIGNTLYCKKGISKGNAYVSIVKEKFPHGYHISDEQDYELLKNYCILEGFPSEDFPSMRSMDCFIGRSSMMPLSKGVYWDEKYSPRIPKHLLNTIYSELSENEFEYYTTILEKHKNELGALGITNRYMLKGLLDLKLPKEFKNHRDYISLVSSSQTALDTITSYIKNQKGLFTLDSIKNQYIGVKDYVFANILFKEEQLGLIHVSTNTYKYFQYYQISDEQKEEIKKQIMETFNVTNEDVISSNKLFARIYFKNKALLDSLGLTGGGFELFSLIKYMFPEFYYSRPLISKNSSEDLSSYTLITDYALKQGEINPGLINGYSQKMGIRQLYSYLEFMDNLSDTFVQISQDTMVKKETTCLDDTALLEIEKSLKMIIQEIHELNTEKFKAYFLFPKIKYKWNKYLLAGIIRSYLHDNYTLQSTTTNYRTTDFIIGRK